MELLTELAVALVALLHFLFLVLEMFLWQTRIGRSVSGFNVEMSAKTAKLAANQGLYNGFLASGLVWSLFAADIKLELRVFFLSCVIIAGLFGAMTVSRSIFLIQATPGIIALTLVLLADMYFTV